MQNLRQRKLWLFGIIAIAVIVILILFAAPNSSGRKDDSGSTYGRNPYGYGAWYEYMSNKEIPIKRWRKPFEQFLDQDVQDVTYIQIRSKTDFQLSRLIEHDLSSSEYDWVSQGNTLVIIGEHQPATAAPFESLISNRVRPLSDQQIKIETTRRHQSDNETQKLLGDQYGAVVWEKTIGKGKVIYSATPYLAANAYQDFPDNYEFLAELVSQNKAIWVDEYIHGYKDKETIAQEQEENVLSYLAKTPLFLLFIQTVIIALIASISAFRRFGSPNIPKTAIVDNSTAYIDALAGVLEKAESTDFVVDTVGKDEQRKLQASLGLGASLVDENTLLSAWQVQREESSAELSKLLKINNTKQKISEAQLIAWIQKWQKIIES
ncbi:DUF4350 domain-containing protein [Pleurocapsa sp. PCC 7319]|uniref:DUF4350 domain-containing protein n=1 Tax=Pleurocapsa sp. PCC 7319 TaxID=118161 RepID=UPI000347BBA3|nr:DUF4350 domain-containing protein [Pleurocapsa sp. PCC 7319]